MPGEVITVDAEVLEALPNTVFRVGVVESDHELLAHLSGRLRRGRVRVVPGDKVQVEMSAYDLSRGRIVFRHRDAPAPPQATSNAKKRRPSAKGKRRR